MESSKAALTELLKQYRAEAGLSFQALSNRSAVDVAYLHRLETGYAGNPSRDILLKIGIGLGLDVATIDYLITTAGHWPLVRDKKIVAQTSEQVASDFET